MLRELRWRFQTWNLTTPKWLAYPPSSFSPLMIHARIEVGNQFISHPRVAKFKLRYQGGHKLRGQIQWGMANFAISVGHDIGRGMNHLWAQINSSPRRHLHLARACLKEIGLSLQIFFNYSILNSKDTWEYQCFWLRNPQTCTFNNPYKIRVGPIPNPIFAHVSLYIC